MSERLVYAKARTVNTTMTTQLRLNCTALDPDGYGICDCNTQPGLEFRVLGLLPGESGIAEMRHKSQHRPVAWAELVTREESSPHRVSPLCPAFGPCGGCRWQHLDYSQQLAAKLERVREALRDFPSLSLETIASSPSTRGYRNQGKYVFAEVDDTIILGAYRERSHDVVRSIGCQTVAPAIDREATRLEAVVRHLGLPLHREDTRVPGLRYALFRCNEDQEVLLTLVVSSALSATTLAPLVDKLWEGDALHGIVRCDNDSLGGALLSEHLQVLRGKGSLPFAVAGSTVQVSPRAFWQINSEVASLAYRDIASSLPLEKGKRVLELYAGVGGIAMHLARAGHDVLAVERDESAVLAGREWAQANQDLEGGLAFLCADARQLSDERFRDVHAIVVDPPRKGLGENECAQLLASSAHHVAYLSCNPVSLARDLRLLCADSAANSFAISSIRCYDFMPGTSQVETLVVLSRTHSERR